MLVLHNSETNKNNKGGLGEISVDGYADSVMEISKFDLTLNVVDLGEELQIGYQYNTDIFTHTFITRIGNHFEQLIECLLTSPVQEVRSLDYLDEHEVHNLLIKLNDTRANYPSDKTLVELFEKRVEEAGNEIALVFEQERLTYQELNDNANRLSHYLRATYLIESEDLVGIKLEPSQSMIIGILAILKCGAAYVPIDPSYPEERVNFIMADTSCKVVIDDGEWVKFDASRFDYPLHNLCLDIHPKQLAYVIYTSGSTGKPKGVMVEHQGVVNRIEWMYTHYGFTSSDIVLQKTTFTFDVSVWEIFMPLCWGCKMIISPKETVRSPQLLLSLIKQEGITCIHFVPSMLNAFIAELFGTRVILNELNTLRVVFTSGEALSLETVKNWYADVKIPVHNLYGPTEASVDVSYYATSSEDVKVPIGRPIWNTQLYVLDHHHRLVPIGVVGEIYIGGDGLARGYLNRSDLTAEKFIPHPFEEGKRLYKTGDLGKWLENENIEYIGRIDHQVKIRGFRIELGEIENVLRGHQAIEDAILMVKENDVKEKELVAYIVTGKDLQTLELRTYLSRSLPDYMIPAYYVILDKLPLTSNGKVDRKALPSPDSLGIDSGYEFVEPRNEREVKVAKIWAEALGKDKIGISDNFFDLGGHSLKAIRLISKLNKEFGRQMNLKDLFNYPTVEQLCSYMNSKYQSKIDDIDVVEENEYYNLSHAQMRVWTLCQMDDASLSFNMPMALMIQGKLDIESFDKAFNLLIDRHEMLRTVFVQHEGFVKQKIVSNSGINAIDKIDLRNSEHKEAELEELINQEWLDVFNLETGPLYRIKLIDLEIDKTAFLFTAHHIITDHLSQQILISEFVQVYHNLVHGIPNSIAPLRIQYKDFAAWQNNKIESQENNWLKDYWYNQLLDYTLLELPLDRSRTSMMTYKGDTIGFSIGEEQVKALENMAKEHHATLFMVLVSITNILLYKYTSETDIVLGTPISNRQHDELENQVGFYLNTLALRTRFHEEDNFSTLLSNVREVCLNAFDHQLYPFDKVVEDLQIKRDLSHHPIFDVMIDMTSSEQSNAPVQNDLLITSIGKVSSNSKFDLTIYVHEIGHELNMGFQYNTDLFDKETIELMSSNFQLILNNIVLDSDRSIEDLITEQAPQFSKISAIKRN